MHSAWAEEKVGPVPRPRSAMTGVALVDESEGHQANLPNIAERRATDTLVHTKLVAEGLFDVSKTSGGRGPTGPSPFDIFASTMGLQEGRSPGDEKREPDAFDVLAQVFFFQRDSVLNQRENAISMLASRLSRAVGREVDDKVSDKDAGLVLEAFRGELLSNYARWCGFLGMKPVSLEALFTPPGGTKARDHAMATEAALMLLIWGEAGNLRLCPEFLCFLFHKMAGTFRTVVEGRTTDVTVPKYLDEVITPAYNMLVEQIPKTHGVIDHSKVRNYDDFNEIFWQESCVDLTIATMFNGTALKKRFQKTFVERQSWLVPIFSFWRVYALQITGLHVMIVAAKCQEGLGTCNASAVGSTIITLYACSLVRDLWDIKQAAFVFGGHRGPFGQLLLNVLRGGLKAAITLLLLVLYWSDSAIFPYTAAIFFLLAAAAEVVMLTELWWGISSYGKWGETSERNCAGGGFAACCPSRIRQLGWSFVGSMCGINSVNLYTQVHSLPPIGKRVGYILFWVLVFATKIGFSYFVVIKKLTVATYTLYNADPSRFSFGVVGTIVDTHNFLYIATLWLGSGLIYFLDMQIWFVVWANITAACEGVRRRVGELNSNSQVIRAFSHLHKEFFSYLKREMNSTTMHTRFAHIWNEIVDAMREEDILSHKERLQLRYFLIQLRLPTVNPNSKNFAPEAVEGEWGPPFTLLPEFLMSGAVQRAVQSATDFGKEIKEELDDLKHEETRFLQSSRLNAPSAAGITVDQRQAKMGKIRAKLARYQARFLEANGNDQVTSEMVRQLSATTFIFLDALCRNEELSRSVWNLHRALFARDVGQGGHGVGQDTGVKAFVFGDNKDKPAVKVVAGFSKKNLLFSVQKFPGFVSAMTDLVKALNKQVSTTQNWSKDVADKLAKMVDSLMALLEVSHKASSDTTSRAETAFLEIIRAVYSGLANWKSSLVEAGGAAPGARPFKATAKEFLRRTQVFLEAPANSQPGFIKGAEARRRITFFVNSLRVEQPKKEKVLKMPALTTLTPYYNEDVVLSIESLRQETQDGVSVLEYLRSIYPDEFDNFVDRMRVICNSKSKEYLFDLDVMDPLLSVVLDTTLGADLSRGSLLRRVERGIVNAAKTIRENDGLSPVDPKQIEEAAKAADVDYIMLQLQLWASNRGQTLARTVRGIMYYSQAVRLLAVVENIKEFQPQDKGYMFGPESASADVGDNEDGGESHGHRVGDVVDLIRRTKHDGGGGGRGDTGGRRRFRRRDHGAPTSPTNAVVGGQLETARQPSFKGFFRTWNRSGVDAEAKLDDQLVAELEEGEGDVGGSGNALHGRAAPSTGAAAGAAKVPPPRLPTRQGHGRPSPVRPAHVAADSSEGRAFNAGQLQGGKFKAAVKRALVEKKRQEEAATRRGRRKKRQTDELEKFKGFIQVKDPALDKICVEYALTAELAETKYRYVVSCQVFGKMQSPKAKSADREKAGHIKMLARMYPGLRIAYVDEQDGDFFSVLSKNAEPGSDDMVEEYRVRLPGNILVGEGKPNNQNHAIIFTRGEAIQAIDMNQDAALEDAIKIRQVMEEFDFAEKGIGRGRNIGRIVGFREHVFTHDVSAVANFFSLQELNFVAATQRVLDNPLHVRFHYGHPDVFDRMSAITFGGVSKASKGIHLSEDIFAGFNYVLRGGEATQADYIQVSKGRDTGVSQVTGFTAKISMGNGMQARSREVSRLASQFDIFRLHSFYYSSVGGFMNQVLLMMAVFLYIYAKLYIAFDPDFVDTVDDEVLDAISSQFLFQLGFLLILPIPLLIVVEQGLQRAFSTLFSILVRLAPFFFIFSAGTNAHYVNSAVMTGQAKYQATGRGFVIAHENFVDMFPLYLNSHFNPAFELLVALIVYWIFVKSGYFLETFSVYLLVIGLLWTPLLFNPNGLDFTYASQDFSGWLEWMHSPVDDPKKGWNAWYSRFLEETRQELPFDKKLQAVFRRARLLILVYGFLTAIGEDYPGGIDGDNKWPGSIVVGAVMLIVVILLMFQSWFQNWLCPPKALKSGVTASRWARLTKLFGLVGTIVGVIILSAVGILVSVRQFFYIIVATAILVYYVSQIMVLFKQDALRKIVVVNLAFKSVHLFTGFVIMIPVLALSFIPLFVDLQTRMLFNEDFSQRFSIAKIFARQSQRQKVKKNQ